MTDLLKEIHDAQRMRRFEALVNNPQTSLAEIQEFMRQTAVAEGVEETETEFVLADGSVAPGEMTVEAYLQQTNTTKLAPWKR